MKLNCILWLTFLTFLFSCQKSEEKVVVDDPHQGEITLTTDESFKSVAEALSERYMAIYPKTKINLKIQKEDLGFLDLMNKKARVAILSRELTKSEKETYIARTDDDILPAPFAADAVVFFVAKNALRSSISLDEIKAELHSEKKNIIFDGTNSSNLNYIAQKLKSAPADMKFSIISGNENVIKEINKYPEKIGVVSLNTFSRPYDQQAQQLKNSVKILAVTDGKNTFLPEIQNITNMKYPFTRVLYFLTNERYFGLGNGFIRFSCQQLGQIVVKKEGLQPYNIFNREVQMR